MKYNAGDYIRFHTPEQWEQIVEKLERDGERVHRTRWEDGWGCLVKHVDNILYRHGNLDVCDLDDITDQFFEELEQEELNTESDQSTTITIQITIN